MPPPYDLVYADPAWSYSNKKTGGSHTSGAAQKYEVMSFHELSKMPVRDICAKNSMLALWATAPFGGDPYALMTEWGFRFKFEMYWHKIGRKGTGYWMRGDVEKLLVGIRGTVKAWRFNHSNHIAHKTLGHSKKPAIFRDILTDHTPDARRVELFATEVPPGYDAYGLALDPTHNFNHPEFWDMLRRMKTAA